MADEPAPPPDSGRAAAPPPGPDFPFLVAAGIALVAALVLVRNLLPAKQDLAETLRREESLQREIEALGREKETLGRQEEALRDDPAYQQRVLRRQTGMTLPGEWIVR